MQRLKTAILNEKQLEGLAAFTGIVVVLWFRYTVFGTAVRYCCA